MHTDYKVYLFLLSSEVFQSLFNWRDGYGAREKWKAIFEMSNVFLTYEKRSQ